MLLAAIASCSRQPEWKISGTVSDASGQQILLQAQDNGRWYTLDTIMTDKKGKFDYTHAVGAYPDIYRLTLGGSSIYFPVDSTESLRLTASSAAFDTDYNITGSTAAAMMMRVDSLVRDVVGRVGVDSALVDRQLKRELGGMILGSPAGVVSYYIVSRQVNGRQLFDPSRSGDLRIIGAVANAFSEQRPGDPRTDYLRTLYLANRINPASTVTDTIVVPEVPYFDIVLTDNSGVEHKLSDAVDKNKVVVLSFTAYTADGSAAYTAALSDLYRDYHAKGMEIYQVACDPDEFQWKQAAKNIPWITVYNPPTDIDALRDYNVGALPSAFVIADGELAARADDPESLRRAVAAHL